MELIWNTENYTHTHNNLLGWNFYAVKLKSRDDVYCWNVEHMAAIILAFDSVEKF